MSYFPDTLKVKTFPCGGVTISGEEKIAAILIEARFIQNFISNGFGLKQFLKLFKKKELSPILSELIYAFGEDGTNFVIRITPTELVAYQNAKNVEMFIRYLNIDFKILNEQNPFFLFSCTSKDKLTRILDKYWGHTLIFEIYVIDRSKTPLLMDIWENHTGKDSKNFLESLKLSRFFLSGADGDELEILSYLPDADLVIQKLEFIARRNGVNVEKSLLKDGAEKYFSISNFVGESTL
jgi:hypothetical protein